MSVGTTRTGPTNIETGPGISVAASVCDRPEKGRDYNRDEQEDDQANSIGQSGTVVMGDHIERVIV